MLRFRTYATRAEMQTAGYIFDDPPAVAYCSKCQSRIEWCTSPRNRRFPLNWNTTEAHFDHCSAGSGPTAPARSDQTALPQGKPPAPAAARRPDPATAPTPTGPRAPAARPAPSPAPQPPPAAASPIPIRPDLVQALADLTHVVRALTAALQLTAVLQPRPQAGQAGKPAQASREIGESNVLLKSELPRPRGQGLG